MNAKERRVERQIDSAEQVMSQLPLILISRALAEKLREDIHDNMRHWSPSDQYADYECCFCGERPPTNQGDIIHRGSGYLYPCNGAKYLAALDEALK